MTDKPSILIVDDDDFVIRLITYELSSSNYNLIIAQNGEEALQKVTQLLPDLILLDAMMPKLNGFEVTRILKARDNTRIIPIVMITLLDDLDSRIHALECGVDDFLTKPLVAPELIARVNSLIRSKKYYDQILNYQNELKIVNTQLKIEKEKATRFASEMEELAKVRAEQLVHADRMTSLGVLSAGLVHEIQNPISFIQLGVTALEKIWPKAKNILQKNNNLDGILPCLSDDIGSAIHDIGIGTKQISQITQSLKSFSRKDPPKEIEFNIYNSIEDALTICHHRLKYNVTLKKEFDQNLPLLIGDPQQIEQVFVNLIINAADAMHNIENSILKISVRHKDQTINIEIDDNGIGIPENILQKIWDPFFTTKQNEKGTGLGLSISKNIIENHGGSISQNPKKTMGTCFLIKLPIKGNKE